MSIDNDFRETLDCNLFNNALPLDLNIVKIILNLWVDCYILHCKNNEKLAIGILEEMIIHYPIYSDLINETICRVKE